jgi:hypothetical protein
MVTYRHDHKYVAEIETMLENLSVRIEKLCSERNLEYKSIADEAKLKLQVNQTVKELPIDDEEVEPEPEPEQEQVHDVEQEKDNEEMEKKTEIKEEEKKNEEDLSQITAIEKSEELPQLTNDNESMFLQEFKKEEEVSPSQSPPLPDDIKALRKKKKKGHQYDSYYMTSHEDIHLYHPGLQKGLIKSKKEKEQN